MKILCYKVIIPVESTDMPLGLGEITEALCGGVMFFNPCWTSHYPG